jgi:hypothetical protein
MKVRINIREISSKTGISKFRLFNIVYNPFYRIKMTDGLAIARALNIKVADLI